MRMDQTILTNIKYEAIIALIHTTDEKKKQQSSWRLIISNFRKGAHFFHRLSAEPQKDNKLTNCTNKQC